MISWCLKYTYIIKYKYIILIFGGVVTFSIGYFLLIYPYVAQYNLLVQQELQLKTTLHKQYKFLSHSMKYQNHLNKLHRKLALKLNLLPKENPLVFWTRYMFRFAKKNYINIIEMTPQQRISHKFFCELPIIAKFTGEYHQLALFFEQLANLPYIITFNNVSIIPNLAGENNAKPLSIAIQMSIYWSKLQC